MLVTAVLVVSFGRLGDIVGRVRMYNMGFAIFTLFSILLSVTWLHGRDAALFMIVMRLMQGVGGAFIMANTAAILTDAFPPNQRGLALGTNMVAAIAGSFIGLVLGGILGPINWRLVFWVSVPVGIIGTVWGVINLKDKGVRNPAKIDWFGNAAFAIGLIALLVGIVYGIEPYAGHTMGWTNPWVLACLIGGLATLCAVRLDRDEGPSPMFRISLFKIRCFRRRQRGQPHGRPRAGRAHVHPHHLATGHLAAQPRVQLRPNTFVGRAFSCCPLTAGFLMAGPVSGYLSDRFGARPFADRRHAGRGTQLRPAGTAPDQFLLYLVRRLDLHQRAGDGPVRLPQPGRHDELAPAGPTRPGLRNGGDDHELGHGPIDRHFLYLDNCRPFGRPAHDAVPRPTAHGVPAASARRVADLPPTSSVFSAFLGYNPVQSMLGPTGVLAHLQPAQAAFLTGRSFFPKLIAVPFGHGLHEALDFALVACLVAAAASAMLGKQYFYQAPAQPARPQN